MDLYDENFKIQDMIESDIRDPDIRDMRCDFDMFLPSNMPGSLESPSLTPLTPVVPMDVLESALDCEMSNDGETGWMNSSQLYNFNGDLDSSVGLLVNPQTALPVSISQPLTTVSTTAVISSSPSSTERTTLLKSTGCQTVTMPVQVITTATFVSPQVGLMDNDESLEQMAVPTPSPSPHNSGQHIETEPKSPKTKVKSKQNSKLTQQIGLENNYPKPVYSYSCLIAMALKNSRNGSLPVNEIYDFMTENFPYFKTAPNGWKNSVRHNLSLNKCFEKIEKPSGNGTQRKGYLWTMNPARVEKMEEELQKWGSKDPEAIRKSMANPERLELIEKGELNSLNRNVQQGISVATTEVENQEIESVDSTEVKTAVDSLNSELSNDCFSPMGETVSMDSSLPELDIKKGIWENLCEDRLQFLGDSPINSSPKHSANLCSPSVILDENSSPTSSPSTMPKSFIHANYIYTFTQFTPSPDSDSSQQLLQHSSVTSTSEKSTVCDA